jgi:hypothetical protein
MMMGDRNHHHDALARAARVSSSASQPTTFTSHLLAHSNGGGDKLFALKRNN